MSVQVLCMMVLPRTVGTPVTWAPPWLACMHVHRLQHQALHTAAQYIAHRM